MSQDVIEDPLVAAIIDGGKNAEGAIIEFIGGHIPEKSANAQSRKSVSMRACAFFSPSLDPVLDRRKRHKDAMVAPEVPVPGR